MVEYTFSEYTDMIFLYGEARGNGRAAYRFYQDRFFQRSTPSHTLFTVIPQRLRERGTVFEINDGATLDDGKFKVLESGSHEYVVLRVLSPLSLNRETKFSLYAALL